MMSEGSEERPTGQAIAGDRPEGKPIREDGLFQFLLAVSTLMILKRTNPIPPSCSPLPDVGDANVGSPFVAQLDAMVPSPSTVCQRGNVPPMQFHAHAPYHYAYHPVFHFRRIP